MICQHNDCVVDEPERLAEYELSTPPGRDNFTQAYCHRHDPRDGELGDLWRLVNGDEQ